jgi:hypothetical protein
MLGKRSVAAFSDASTMSSKELAALIDCRETELKSFNLKAKQAYTSWKSPHATEHLLQFERIMDGHKKNKASKKGKWPSTLNEAYNRYLYAYYLPMLKKEHEARPTAILQTGVVEGRKSHIPGSPPAKRVSRLQQNYLNSKN